jgi:lipopolysaccharide biosynthesis glycosyltransferase
MGAGHATIAVACAANAPYALPLAVTLNSAGANLAPGFDIQAYVLDDRVPADDKLKVVRSLPDNVRLEWRQPVSPLHGFPIWGRMPSTTYQKFTLDEWIPTDVGRVLWLDCDLLVLGDIASLWRSANAATVMAVQDQRVPTVSSEFGVAAWRELGLAKDAKYFNAGVLLIDVAGWRARDVRRHSMDYIRTYADRVYFWDQEALNAVLAGKWGELDPRWNWHPSLGHLSRAGGNGAELAQVEAAWILHFSGNLKPWSVAGTDRWRTLYRSYLDRTAWAGWRPRRRLQDGVLTWYETSYLRRLLYPTERLAVKVQRTMTRRAAGF